MVISRIPEVAQHSLLFEAARNLSVVRLRRIDPTRDRHRFYRFDVPPDSFGGVMLVKEWGRMVAERYETEALAGRCHAAAGRAQEIKLIRVSNRE